MLEPETATGPDKSAIIKSAFADADRLLRAQLSVFVEDVLPDDLIQANLLQRRFSRQHLLRESPTLVPAEYWPTQVLYRRRFLSLTSLRYTPAVVPRTGDCFAMESTFDPFLSRSSVCVSFVENLSAFEFYILGALRGALVPTVLLTQNAHYPFNQRIPTEYQARIVNCSDMQGVCQTVEKEIAIFEEDYLDIRDQERVLRYRAALIQEGHRWKIFEAHARHGGKHCCSERWRNRLIEG